MANRPIHVVESGGDSTGLKEFADGADSGVQIPSGTTAQRDSSASAGEVRFNTDNKKLEYYNGARWVSNSFVDVDDAEYDGVMTIMSNTHSTIPAAYRGSITGIQRNNNGRLLDGDSEYKRTINNFMPFGTATKRTTHSGLTEADARFGAAGLNTLESEHNARHTPILELKTDMADGAMGSNSNTYSNLGAIAFTGKIGTYDYNGYTANTYGWSNANKDFNAAAITVRSKRMHAGYYDYYFAPPTDLDFFISTGYSGPKNVLSFGNRNGSHTNFTNATFLLGRTANYAGNNRNELATFTFHPGNNDAAVGTTKEGTSSQVFTLATTEHIRASVAPSVNIGESFGARAKTASITSNKTNYWIYHHPTEIVLLDANATHNANPFGTFHFVWAPRGHSHTSSTMLMFKYRFIYLNGSTSTSNTYGINISDIEAKGEITSYSGTSYLNANLSAWSSVPNASKKTFDSSFPSGGSITTGTLSAYGFISWTVEGTYIESNNALSIAFKDFDTTHA